MSWSLGRGGGIKGRGRKGREPGGRGMREERDGKGGKGKAPWDSAVLQVANSHPPVTQLKVTSVHMQVTLERELQGEAARPCAMQGV